MTNSNIRAKIFRQEAIKVPEDPGIAHNRYIHIYTSQT